MRLVLDAEVQNGKAHAARHSLPRLVAILKELPVAQRPRLVHDDNPLAGRRPPRYFQVLAYRYRFTTRDERTRNGNWWQAEYLGEFPDVSPRRP